jgi:hypothetical protein
MVRGAQRISTPPEPGLDSGAGPKPGEWLSPPESIHAPSPFDRFSLCRLKISRNDIQRAASVGRRQIVFDLWSMVIGKPPPVPGVHARNDLRPDELISVTHAHAYFRGIERPLRMTTDPMWSPMPCVHMFFTNMTPIWSASRSNNLCRVTSYLLYTLDFAIKWRLRNPTKLV